MLLEDVLKEFVFDCKLRKISERTIKSYQNNKRAVIKSYIKYLMDKQLTESYVNGMIKVMRAYFKYAYREEYIIRNPMEKISFQKEPITLINKFTDDEVMRMVRFYRGSRYLDIRNQLIKYMRVRNAFFAKKIG